VKKSLDLARSQGDSRAMMFLARLAHRQVSACRSRVQEALMATSSDKRYGCMSTLKQWAATRGVKVHPASRAKGLDMKAPHSELCMHVRCAGKRIRAFAIDPKHGSAGIVFSDKNGQCAFTSGLDSEVIQYGTVRELRSRGLGGAKRRRR